MNEEEFKIHVKIKSGQMIREKAPILKILT